MFFFISALGWMPRGCLHTNSVRAQGPGAPQVQPSAQGTAALKKKKKIARRNISNPRYADVTNLMAESEEELKSLLIKVKE